MHHARRRGFAQQLLGAVDLAIDFATLGEYGLEVVPADGPCRERPGKEVGWEALARPTPGDGRRPGRRGGRCPSRGRGSGLRRGHPSLLGG